MVQGRVHKSWYRQNHLSLHVGVTISSLLCLRYDVEGDSVVVLVRITHQVDVLNDKRCLWRRSNFFDLIVVNLGIIAVALAVVGALPRRGWGRTREVGNGRKSSSLISNLVNTAASERTYLKLALISSPFKTRSGSSSCVFGGSGIDS
jgi:hypothetical protein